MNRLLPTATLVLALGGCAESSLLLVIDGDFTPGRDVDAIEVVVFESSYGTRGDIVEGRVFTMTFDHVLPQTIGVWAGSSVNGSIELDIAALKNLEPVLSATRSTRFQQGEQIELELCFYMDCTETPLDAACTEARCTR